MFGESGKNKLMVFLMFLMAFYFIGINFLKQIDKVNSNNTYVSMNLVYSTKQDYISQYIESIQNKKYSDAFYMLDDTTKTKFNNDISKFKEYAEETYKNINKRNWKFEFKELSQEELRKEKIYTYQVLDGDDKETSFIDKITIYEYAVNVFKIHLEGVK